MPSGCFRASLVLGSPFTKATCGWSRIRSVKFSLHFLGILEHAMLPDLPASSDVYCKAPSDTVPCLLTQCMALILLLH